LACAWRHNRRLSDLIRGSADVDHELVIGALALAAENVSV
jgi:hypothetical protein